MDTGSLTEKIQTLLDLSCGSYEDIGGNYTSIKMEIKHWLLVLMILFTKSSRSLENKLEDAALEPPV